jgi:hypothetical protein
MLVGGSEETDFRMKQPLWQRRRRRVEQDAPPPTVGAPVDAPGDASDVVDGNGDPRDPGRARAGRSRGEPVSSAVESGNGTEEGDPAPRAPGADGRVSTVGTSGAQAEPGADRQAAYAAWADRMRSHKQDKLADIRAAQQQADAAQEAPGSPYWDVSNLFAGPDPDAPSDPRLMETSQLLEILEVGVDASPPEIQAAYRRLVKEHHPDRWIDAAPEVRDEHETRMALISEAHRELRRRSS